MIQAVNPARDEDTKWHLVPSSMISLAINKSVNTSKVTISAELITLFRIMLGQTPLQRPFILSFIVYLPFIFDNRKKCVPEVQISPLV